MRPNGKVAAAVVLTCAVVGCSKRDSQKTKAAEQVQSKTEQPWSPSPKAIDGEGFVGTPSPQLKRQVDAINIRRRNLYIGLSTRRNVSPQLAGMATACQLLSRLGAGEAYMLADGAWRRKTVGQAVPLPDYCR